MTSKLYSFALCNGLPFSSVLPAGMAARSGIARSDNMVLTHTQKTERMIFKKVSKIMNEDNKRLTKQVGPS